MAGQILYDAVREKGAKCDSSQIQTDDRLGFSRQASSRLTIAVSDQISKLVLQAAEDCGKDPNCICDFAGQPRRCLFSYCCGTVSSFNFVHLSLGRSTAFPLAS